MGNKISQGEKMGIRLRRVHEALQEDTSSLSKSVKQEEERESG